MADIGDYIDLLQEAADELPKLEGCTGFWLVLDGVRVHLNHDGDSCPVHESEEAAIAT